MSVVMLRWRADPWGYCWLTVIQPWEHGPALLVKQDRGTGARWPVTAPGLDRLALPEVIGALSSVGTWWSRES